MYQEVHRLQVYAVFHSRYSNAVLTDYGPAKKYITEGHLREFVCGLENFGHEIDSTNLIRSSSRPTLTT